MCVTVSLSIFHIQTNYLTNICILRGGGEIRLKQYWHNRDLNTNIRDGHELVGKNGSLCAVIKTLECVWLRNTQSLPFLQTSMNVPSVNHFLL